MKETAYTIDGQEIAFMAPSIKKYFYFPEDARTTEKWNAVQSHVDECSKSVEYFKASYWRLYCFQILIVTLTLLPRYRLSCKRSSTKVDRSEY